MIEGELEAEAFDFKEVPLDPFSPLHSCGFYNVVAKGMEFDLDAVQLSVAWSQFDECTFRQRIRKSIDGVWPQGSLGLSPTIYRRCTFQGVRFRIRGGFSVGHGRFEGCTFHRCRFEEHFSFCADYVGCTFEGKIRTAVFYGRAPDHHGCDSKVNEIARNDFSRGGADGRRRLAWKRRSISTDLARWVRAGSRVRLVGDEHAAARLALT